MWSMGYLFARLLLFLLLPTPATRKHLSQMQSDETKGVSSDDGLHVILNAAGGLEVDASGIAIKDADKSVNLSASGLKVESFVKMSVLAGGAAGDITLTGIAVGDVLIGVLRFDVETDKGDNATGNKVQNVSDLTSEFTVGANKINNTGGTNTTGDILVVLWENRT